MNLSMRCRSSFRIAILEWQTADSIMFGIIIFMFEFCMLAAKNIPTVVTRVI